MEEAPRAPVPWLPIGRSVGRVAAGLLIASNFVYLLAPLFYLASALAGRGRSLDFTDPSAALLLLLADSRWILALGDGLVAIGAALVAGALLSLVLDLRPRPGVTRDTLLLGVAAFACALGWAVAAGLALGRPRGSGLEAVSAEGGGSPAAALLLAASVLYVVFSMRFRKSPLRGPEAPMRWAIYAGANLVGSVAIAGLFVGGSGDPDVLTFGLALQIILIPLVGVAAYKDLWDHVGEWKARKEPGALPVGEIVAARVETEAPTPVEELAAEEPELEGPPPPPPPE